MIISIVAVAFFLLYPQALGQVFITLGVMVVIAFVFGGLFALPYLLSLLAA